MCQTSSKTAHMPWFSLSVNLRRCLPYQPHVKDMGTLRLTDLPRVSQLAGGTGRAQYTSVQLQRDVSNTQTKLHQNLQTSPHPTSAPCLTQGFLFCHQEGDRLTPTLVILPHFHYVGHGEVFMRLHHGLFFKFI